MRNLLSCRTSSIPETYNSSVGQASSEHKRQLLH